MKPRKLRMHKITLNEKLRKIIISMLLPPIVCVIISLFILVFYAYKYGKITHNVNVSSKFNLDFKNTVDLKMYHFTVGSKEQTELPLADVENAIDLAVSLRQTTYRKESRRALRNILDYCSNLKRKMSMLEQTQDYDSRELQLENNIYVLTGLIQEKIIDYIYYEAGYMSGLEQEMLKNIKLAILIAFFFMSGMAVSLFYSTFRFSKSITGPISELCENVRRVGNGEFTIPGVKANNYEIEQLNAGIQNMASRIQVLLHNVKEEEKLQHMTKLRLLQAQINPHFLYNTLDTIIWLVETERYGEAVDMLTNLSLFFRTILSRGNDMISLGDEVMHTRSYLDIQQVRYQDILDYHIYLPDTLKEVPVPKLTLQPLAENALYHGVKEKRGKSTIHITCAGEGDDILLTVWDNGIGIQPEKLKSIRHSLEHSERIGFGLAAVHERIRLYFGESYGVRISSEYGSGTTVEVRIPKNNEQES